jgi:hypothetical protein
MTTLTLRFIKKVFIVNGPDIAPAKFKSRREAKDWCVQHYPGSPIYVIGADASKRKSRAMPRKGPLPRNRLRTPKDQEPCRIGAGRQAGRGRSDNPLWGAPRIHGELLKLGFEVAQSNVAKYMVKRCEPPSQGWRTFLRNHAPDIAAMDLFVAPTIGFDLLYVLVIIRLERRNLVWINVTPHPSAE